MNIAPVVHNFLQSIPGLLSTQDNDLHIRIECGREGEPGTLFLSGKDHRHISAFLAQKRIPFPVWLGGDGADGSVPVCLRQARAWIVLDCEKTETEFLSTLNFRICL